ncbi:HAMP domain-containing sensor histidine kinase [Pseudomonas sp. UBA2684]|uniref:HAMP domain-containing sensor histidine kinase n=1 Tax=Pseudomonas sp. UBA2684 TaxID=1947311 RepID=UPI0025E2FD55|nr:histidine kinase [Pseudomonas sp. UBA2684]
MSALWRINLLVTLFFSAVAVIGLALLLRQASHDVQREMQAAEAVVEYLRDAALRDPASLQSSLTGSLRHVRVQWLTAASTTEPATDSLAKHLLSARQPPVLVQLADGRRLRIAVDPSDEIDEVWDSLLQLLVLCALALALSLLTIRWAVRRGLRVLDELLAGLQQVTQGQFDARLHSRSLPEARQLAGHFNFMATTLQQVQADNAELTQALMALQERERARLGQTLHDDLGQYLSGIRAQACLLRAVADQPEVVRSTAHSLEEHSQHLQDGFRAQIRDLYPVVLERLELGAALQQLTVSWQTAQGIRCRLLLSEDLPALPLPSKAHLYRLVQEALTNVARHAQASEVRVRLQHQGGRLRLLVRDNGSGAQMPQRPGIGLRSISERARCLGGVLRLHSRPGAGWILCLSVPLEVNSR